MVFNVFGFYLFKLGDINFTGGNKDEISSIVKLLCVIKLVV